MLGDIIAKMTNAEISCNPLLINPLSSELIFINSLSAENNFVVFVISLMAL